MHRIITLAELTQILDELPLEYVIEQGNGLEGKLTFLEYCNGDEQPVDLVMEKMSACREVRLEDLSLSFSKVSTASFQRLVSLGRQLTSLSLFGSPFSEVDLKYVGKLSNLTYLDAGESNVGDLGVEYLKSLERLELLALAKTRITDASCGVFSQLPGLTHLYVQACDISDTGVISLASSSTLKFVYANDTKVTEKAASALVEKGIHVEI